MFNPYPKELQRLAEIKSLFASRGWMSATSGNFSLRLNEDPLEFYISVSGRDKSVNLPDDFLLVNEKGEPLNEKGEITKGALNPSAEVGVHAEIYKKLSPGVVLHVHTLYNTFVSIHSSDLEVLTIKGLEMIKGLGLWEENRTVQIPIVPNYHHLGQLASSVGKVIHSSTPGVLIRGHGLYAWGETLHDAKRNVEAFEFLFQYLCLEAQIKR